MAEMKKKMKEEKKKKEEEKKKKKKEEEEKKKEEEEEEEKKKKEEEEKKKKKKKEGDENSDDEEDEDSDEEWDPDYEEGDEDIDEEWDPDNEEVDIHGGGPDDEKEEESGEHVELPVVVHYRSSSETRIKKIVEEDAEPVLGKALLDKQEQSTMNTYIRESKSELAQKHVALWYYYDNKKEEFKEDLTNNYIEPNFKKIPLTTVVADYEKINDYTEKEKRKFWNFSSFFVAELNQYIIPNPFLESKLIWTTHRYINTQEIQSMFEQLSSFEYLTKIGEKVEKNTFDGYDTLYNMVMDVDYASDFSEKFKTILPDIPNMISSLINYSNEHGISLQNEYPENFEMTYTNVDDAKERNISKEPAYAAYAGILHVKEVNNQQTCHFLLTSFAKTTFFYIGSKTKIEETEWKECTLSAVSLNAVLKNIDPSDKTLVINRYKNEQPFRPYLTTMTLNPVVWIYDNKAWMEESKLIYNPLYRETIANELGIDDEFSLLTLISFSLGSYEN
jgi:hypothetical protein